MDPVKSFKQLLQSDRPVLALAPMQDVTDLPFWRVIAAHGGPDLYFTEYFRVYPGSRLNPHVLHSITANPTGKPVIAQMIGNDVPTLTRTARELQQHPVAAIDLNLGCPAPVVYRKRAGGGLLRELDAIDSILGALRDTISIPFTVKTRLGFESPNEFEELLQIFAKHAIDLLTVHGRTVSGTYRAEVRYDLIARAAASLLCPVLANGNIHSAHHADQVLQLTGARGLMIGRGAIRNPWLFHQIRQHQRGEQPWIPSGHDVFRYLRILYQTVRPDGLSETRHVAKMKKFMNYVALGIEPTGQFLHAIRRVTSERQFFDLCHQHLDHDQPMPLEPFEFNLPDHDIVAGCHG